MKENTEDKIVNTDIYLFSSSFSRSKTSPNLKYNLALFSESSPLSPSSASCSYYPWFNPVCAIFLFALSGSQQIWTIINHLKKRWIKKSKKVLNSPWSLNLFLTSIIPWTFRTKFLKSIIYIQAHQFCDSYFYKTTGTMISILITLVENFTNNNLPMLDEWILVIL